MPIQVSELHARDALRDVDLYSVIEDQPGTSGDFVAVRVARLIQLRHVEGVDGRTRSSRTAGRRRIGRRLAAVSAAFLLYGNLMAIAVVVR